MILGLISALLALRAVPHPHRMGRPSSEEYLELAGAIALALLGATIFAESFFELVPVFLLVLGLIALLCAFVTRLSMPGILWIATLLAMLPVTRAWAWLFVFEGALPWWLDILALTGIALSLIGAGIAFAESFAREAVLTHELWRRPVSARLHSGIPVRKVSLHLPCYAEPPEIVKATMDCLAALDYPDYEVLVCDNNTRDEALWRPLEVHCAALNRRLGREVFRFFHVAPLAGAKAGALNFLMDEMAEDAEIIGVIDADYHSRPDFLARLVPFFDDPALGYIQTPHDYHAWQGSSYLTACYWEYMPANKVDWAGISEYGGAFTIGTMCLLRTEALRMAGGWAEWCLTEDSEVSVRMRAAGYRGLYFVETFGKGLIPETFDDYKKQRFRWTAGPVQQLRRHWRLFLPAPFAPAMPGWTKLLEITRCSAPLLRLAGVVTALAGAIGMGAALAFGAMEPIAMPAVSWWLALVGIATFMVRTAHRYRLSGCDNSRDMVRGEIARASLNWVVLVAGVAGLSSRPLAWRRTPKFTLDEGEPSPFAATRAETTAGTVCLTLALLVLASMDLWGGGMALFVAGGFAVQAAGFFCAPLMSAMAMAHAAALRPASRPAPVLREAVPALAE